VGNKLTLNYDEESHPPVVSFKSQKKQQLKVLGDGIEAGSERPTTITLP